MIGPFDLFAVCEGDAGATNATRWGCVDHAPPGLGGFDQFERHRDASGPRAGALGDALAEAHNRLGRSIRHLIDQLQALAEREVGFRSLQETIDTRSPGVRLVFHVFAALAEFERDLIRKRTNAGLEAARARGRTGGRPPSLSADQARAARRMYEQKDMAVAQIGKVLGVDRTTIYRALNRAPFTTSPPRRPETPVQWGTPQHDTSRATVCVLRGTKVRPGVFRHTNSTGRSKHGASTSRTSRRPWLCATTPQPGQPPTDRADSTLTASWPAPSRATAVTCNPSRPTSKSQREQ